MFGDSVVDRRTFLRAGVTGAGMLGAVGLLAACGSPAPSSSGAAAGGTAVTPKYIPFAGKPTPDFPGNEFGLADAYMTYPANPAKLTKGIPGDGSAVSAMTITYDPIVPGVDSNQYYQEVNKRLGIKLNMQQTPSADYATKLPTVLAGNDLPDFVQFQVVQPSFPDLLKAKFQDLSPFLSGDKIKDYPFLANIPDYFWTTSAMYNGGIYGIPVAAYKMVNYLFTRDDIITGMGLDPAFKNWSEFLDLVKAVNLPDKSQWALDHVVESGTKPAATFGYALQCLGVANGFAEKDGKFTSYHSDEKTKEAISECAKLVKGGYVHPDAFSGSTVDWVTNIAVGQAVLGMPGGLTSLPRFYNLSVDDKMVIGGSGPVPFDDSTKAHGWQRTPAFSLTAIKKGDDDRIEMLLEVANYLAAPFGSEEYRFINFGIEDVDWQSSAAGDPTSTPLGKTETLGFGLPYIACPPRVLYTPGLADPTKRQWEVEKSMMEDSIADASLGLYSETYGRKWAQLEKTMSDAQAEIMKGNQPMSAWDDAVKNWKSSGGDQMIKEYEAAYAAANK